MRNKPYHLKSFDYLKTIAIIMVIITHVSFTPTTRKILLFPFWIDMAVPIFFIISGYVYSLSAEKREIYKIKDWFKINNFIQKLFRIMIPYLLILMAEVLLFKILDWNILTKELIKGFFTGGWGPGSYYFPVLFQLLFLFPIILYVAKRKFGWIYLILAQIILEVITQKLEVSDWMYRLLFLRYLGFVTFGVLLYLNHVEQYKGTISKIIKNNYLLILSISLGIGVIYIFNYTSYQPYLFRRWSTTALPTILYIFSFIVLFMKWEKLLTKIPQILDNIVSIIAKSTYHIFLVQMVYYWFKMEGDVRLLHSIILSFIICIPLGVVFYYVESFITEKLYKLGKNNLLPFFIKIMYSVKQYRTS